MIALDITYDGIHARKIGSVYGYTSIQSARKAAKREIERHRNATISIVEEFHSPYAPDYYKTLTSFENKDGVVTERKHES